MEKLQVNVRMYPVGELGDCFLLNFNHGEQQSAVLIDCGSFRNSGTSVTRMNAIVSDIMVERKSGASIKPLDLVIGTHQHNDHLSGFKHAETLFEQMGMSQVWLSWLDDPHDIQAGKIAGGQRKVSKQLQEISSKLAARGTEKGMAIAEHINDELGFYGLAAAAAGGTPVIPQQGIDNLQRIGKKVSYLTPGQVLDLPGLPPGQVKVYVLGPPRDNNLLFDINPGKGESYESKLTGTLNMTDAFLSALSNAPGETKAATEPFFPFDEKYARKIDGSEFLESSYSATSNDWRTIDDDWLDQAERLALYLDSYTNNSSLVLAFELVESGKVMLFVGDAQTGNWLSWKTIDWKDSGISLDQLLKQTVLYKVGHHCSHNATLPECLEKMAHPELVAMIPVDRSDPNITKAKGWKMPAASLYKRLKEVTKGRILRMDGYYETDCGPASAAAEWAGLNANITFDQQKLPGSTIVNYQIKG